MDIKEKISRKKFLGITSLTLVGTFIASSPFLSLDRGKYRIKPIAGKKYSPSFLKLCERGRFRTAQEAIKSIRDRVTKFEVVLESKA